MLACSEERISDFHILCWINIVSINRLTFDYILATHSITVQQIDNIMFGFVVSYKLEELSLVST